MSGSDPFRRTVDSVAGRTGLTRDAVAILFILAGVLILIFEDVIRIVLGLLLIVVGVVWLVNAWQERNREPPRP